MGGVWGAGGCLGAWGGVWGFRGGLTLPEVTAGAPQEHTSRLQRHSAQPEDLPVPPHHTLPHPTYTPTPPRNPHLPNTPPFTPSRSAPPSHPPALGLQAPPSPQYPPMSPYPPPHPPRPLCPHLGELRTEPPLAVTLPSFRVQVCGERNGGGGGCRGGLGSHGCLARGGHPSGCGAARGPMGATPPPQCQS